MLLDHDGFKLIDDADVQRRGDDVFKVAAQHRRPPQLRCTRRHAGAATNCQSSSLRSAP
jgi:hypothetical protein